MFSTVLVHTMKISEAKTTLDPIDFHCMDRKYWETFEFYRKKEIHSGLEQDDSDK